MKKFLIIEDDVLIVDLVRIHLRSLPADLIATASGQEGLDWLVNQPVDLCILDIMLPGMNGIDICRQIRQRDNQMPILMLTAKAQETDKVLGLEAGADDYLTKPFGIMEFMARVRAMLRRGSLDQADSPASPLMITHSALSIHIADRIVTLHGNRVELTPKEFDLLVLLAGNPGKSYSRKVGYSVGQTQHPVELRGTGIHLDAQHSSDNA